MRCEAGLSTTCSKSADLLEFETIMMILCRSSLWSICWSRIVRSGGLWIYVRVCAQMHMSCPVRVILRSIRVLILHLRLDSGRVHNCVFRFADLVFMRGFCVVLFVCLTVCFYACGSWHRLRVLLLLQPTTTRFLSIFTNNCQSLDYC